MSASPGHHVLKYSLLTEILNPLVLGGALVPMPPVGAVKALPLLELVDQTALLEPQSLLTLARVRVARALAPIDFVSEIAGPEWALAAAYNDLLQATHPDYRNTFRTSGPQKLLESIAVVLAHVGPPRTIGEGLSRYTLFSRFFEAARTDVKLSWWTGSATFLGTPPPKRLGMWPEIRQVRENRTVRTIMDLANPETSKVDAVSFEIAVRDFLTCTPLTDLATCDRPNATFTWTPSTISFVGARAGCTLAVRAMAKRPTELVDNALGLATSKLFGPDGAPVVAAAAIQAVTALLAERAMGRAWKTMEEGRTSGVPGGAGHVARLVGARSVRAWLTAHPHMMSARTRELLLDALMQEAPRKQAPTEKQKPPPRTSTIPDA